MITLEVEFKMQNRYYDTQPTQTLKNLFQKADTLKTQIEEQKNNNQNL